MKKNIIGILIGMLVIAGGYYFYNNSQENTVENIYHNENTKAYETLTKHLKERNLDLCSLVKLIEDIELNSIHKADEKYPNYDYPEHLNYTTMLIKKEEGKLINKHNLTDSIFYTITGFGMEYCD